MARCNQNFALALLVFAALGVSNTSASEGAPNFRLLDTSGVSHELFYHSNKPAVLLHFVTHACGATDLPSQVLAEASALQVPVFAVSADHKVQPSIENAVGTKSIKLFDEASLVARDYGVRRHNEWRLVNAQEQRLIEDGHAGLASLQNALAEVLPSTCDLLLAPTPVTTPSFTTDVAPLLIDRCVTCHRSGGIAPWPMASYELVRGFAPMIKEVLATRRMPPWHADPHVGAWRQDQGLTTAQRLTLVNWIDRGTPRGEGEDPLPEAAAQANGTWPLGPPDLVIALPQYAVPATGVLDYRNVRVTNPLQEARWIKASSIRTNVPAVLHHVLAGAGNDPGPGSGVGDEILFSSFIQAFAPGIESYETPPGTGIELLPEDTFLFQNHYTTNGKAHTETTELALYFHDEPPNRPLRHSVVMNKALKIPPNAAQHADEAYFDFPQPATLYGLLAHAHYRGKSGRFWLRNKKGDERLLLSVPNYDFNWQRTYNFVEPVSVQKGDRLIYRAQFDNSAQNPGNPDPTITVRWGEQSFEEMLYGSFLFSWDNETQAQQVHDEQWMLIASEVGYRDTNKDGLIQRKEMPFGLKLLTFGRFSKFDTNDDRALDIAEIQAVMNWAQSKRWLRWLFFMGV